VLRYERSMQRAHHPTTFDCQSHYNSSAGPQLYDERPRSDLWEENNGDDARHQPTLLPPFRYVLPCPSSNYGTPCPGTDVYPSATTTQPLHLIRRSRPSSSDHPFVPACSSPVSILDRISASVLITEDLRRPSITACYLRSM
jgi:hypothetical protein